MLGDAIGFRSTLEPTIERLGYELVYVTLVDSKTRLLRMFIDAPGGITLGDCERVSRRVSDILDVEELIEGEYTLEVSSPGLDRPLAKKEHFEDAKGKEVYIRMHGLHLGRRKFRGSLVEVERDAALLDINGERLKLRFCEMQKANLVPLIQKDDRSRREGKNG